VKVSTFVNKFFKATAWTLMSAVLLCGAILTLVYAPWSQEYIRQYIVQQMNDNGIRMQLDSFELHFPLNVHLSGLVLDMPGQSISAGRLDASVGLLPLLSGHASVSEARLYDGMFVIGTPDSTMYMTVRGHDIALRDADVALTSMNIDLTEARITGGRVSMLLNPDTTAADTTVTPPTEMSILVRKLTLDDFAYDMRMLPTIDSLGAVIPTAAVSDINIDLYRQTIGLRSFTGSGLDVAYIAPDSATVAATPEAPADSTATASAPWTIRIDTIGFDRSRALYTTRNVKPMPGLDFAYIQVDSLNLGIRDFYNRAAEVRVPLRIHGTERCGVTLDASGSLVVDSLGTNLYDFNVSTPESTELNFNALIGMGDMTNDPSTPLGLHLNGEVSPSDALMMFPAFAPYLLSLPQNSPVIVHADIDGTAGDLTVGDFTVNVNGTARLSAKGRVINAFDPAHISGNLTLSGALLDLNRFKSVLFDKNSAAEFNIPRTTFSGHVNMNSGNIAGRLKARTEQGRINLDADWHSRLEDYTIHLRADSFPVDAFMPLSGIGELSATLDAKGHGYNPFAKNTRLDATLDITRAVYQKYDYADISATARVADGQAEAIIDFKNPNAALTLSAHGNLDGDTYNWTADLDGRHIDLQALGLSPAKALIKTKLGATASISPKTNEIGAGLMLNSLSYTTEFSNISISNVTAHLNANDSTTNISAGNGDMYAFVSSESSIDSIMARVSRLSTILADEAATRTIDVERIQQALPPFNLDLTAGSRNAVTDMLAESRTTFRSLHIQAANDSSLSMNARLLGLATPSMMLDTITFDLAQYADRLIFDGAVENRPGTFDEWAHVRLEGYVADNTLGMLVTQRNIQDKEGYSLGLRAELNDSTLRLSLDPTDPTIAYMPWTVNDDNFITWSFAHKHLDANLHMHSDKSSIAIYTNHEEGHDDHQEALVVDINDINIADWIKLNPFAPPMDGTLSAAIKVNGEGRNINGEGTVTLADFTYDRQRVGSVQTDLKVSTDLGGHIRAAADMFIDGHKTITLAGALNDSTAGSPLAMDLSVIHLPLKVANPFIGADIASLSGFLNGSMDVSGPTSAPKLDGWLQLDSAAVRVSMTGTSYKFNNVKIPVDSSMVRFNNFAISGVNENPLTVNGTVDIHDFANPGINLFLNASNMQICNTGRAPKGADIYGKGFINLNASVKGNMNFMSLNANMTVLPGTNITYVMTDAQSAIANQANDDMVRFVNLADTTAVQLADSTAQSSLAMLIEATLTLQTGSTINIDLSANGRDRVSIRPNGTVDFTMQPFGEPRLTGRINIPEGFVRYTPPVLSEKLFNFEDNSYVAFNGDIMNPRLNINAIDVLKANVTQTGQNSRLVNFNVHLNITGTLSHMNVAFDLSTDDDITVANELQSMSAEQRANQAMNMLLYNVYTGPGTRGDSNLSGNALYSFLSSQINNWAASNIKGVDLTFGIDQYDRTVGGSTSQTTSYSYQVSKSLFNDRFKIVVGGNYSTDANADENFSQNLIKDISFEYFLNNARTMYVRLFRHTGYESILEGEITRTGAGFVYKRKINRISDLFRLRRRNNRTTTGTQQITDTQKNAGNESSK